MKYKILIFALIFSISLFAKSDIPIIDAAGKGDINKVRTLIKEGANINQQDRIGENALIEAAEGGHIEIVKLLIDCSDKIEQGGYFVNVDELDLGDQYKVTFTINKE